MFRVILYLLFTVIIITILRGVIGVVARGFGQFINPPQSPKARPGAGNQVPLTGELKRDPACGTYIAAASSIKETVGGEAFYFCSKECRDKYLASPAR